MVRTPQNAFDYFQIKDTWSAGQHGDNQINPFSRGNALLNCFATLCGPLPPSFLDLRAVVKEDNSIPMVTIETNRNAHDTVRYHADDNGSYANRVVSARVGVSVSNATPEAVTF